MTPLPHDQARAAKTGLTSSITRTPSLENMPDKRLDQFESSNMLAPSVARERQSWRAPLIILSNLLAGLICALAHHFINAHLGGRVVANTAISQPWVLRLQTIFAFLVKMFLTISVCAAFVQRQWWDFQRQRFSIYEIDAVTTVLGDLLGLLTLSAWRKVPLLAVAAFISWTIPFAAVISPGSLSIALNETQRTIPDLIPQPFYNNSAPFTNSAAFRSAAGTSIGEFVATTELWQIALSVAVSGQMAALAMPHRNMTYRYQFHGPVLKCVTVQNVTELTRTMNTTYQDNLTSANYTSWVADSGLVFDKTLDSSSNELIGAGIYVARGSGPGYDGAPAQSRNTNVTECRLHYGLYDLAFQFRFPEQNFTLLKLDYGAPVSLRIRNVDTITDWSPIAHAGIMEAFGRLLVGFITSPPPTGVSIGTQSIEATSANILHIDWSEAETTRIGLEQLFQNITLSLLSRSSFIKNSTQASLIPITVFSFVNVYRYDQTDLFLAYGLALLGTLLCAIMGLHATWANKGSYRNTFSTFMRSSNNHELRSLFDLDDDGRDPLLEHLGRIELTMHRRRQK